MEYNKAVPLCPSSEVLIGYTFVRHIGFILDELSSQGLDLWRDEQLRWYWQWLGTASRECCFQNSNNLERTGRGVGCMGVLAGFGTRLCAGSSQRLTIL